MNRVSRIILDELRSRHSVWLPEVGLLEVKRRKAKRISETQIIPPQNVVTFSHDNVEDTESVISLLARNMGESEAGDLYYSWLENAGKTSDGGILIDGAGEIKDGRFLIAESLHVWLNPVKEDIVTMERERNGSGSMWPWLIVGILAALLVFGMLWCWKNGVFDRQYRDRDIETVVIPITEPVDDTSTDVAAEVDPAEVTPVVPSEPRFHVIAGSFAVEGNAEKLMQRLKRNYPDLTLEKIVNPRNGYDMVSIFSAPTERQAYNKMNMYWDIDLYLWVYEEK